MQSFDDTIKFMMANIMFTLRDFRFQILDKPYPPHYHGKNTLEIHFIKKGSGKVILDDKEYLVKENSFFITPPFLYHTQIPDENTPFEKYSIYLLVDSLHGFNNYLPLLNKSFIGIDKYNTVSLFDKILDEFKNQNFGYNEIVVSCFKNIFIYLMRDLNYEHERVTKWIPDTKAFEIEKALLNEFQTLTLDSLANRMYMSKRELQRFLKQNYNKNFNDLKIESRMNYAKMELIYSNKSIIDIAYELGYSSYEHFSYAFKKMFDISPSTYRKNSRK